VTAREKIEPQARPRRAVGLRATPVGDDLVLLDPVDYRAITLNLWARDIWQLCDGERTLQEIIDDLDCRFEAESGRVDREVRQVVSEMLSAGILSESNPAP
jgi:hypothetical protein